MGPKKQVESQLRKEIILSVNARGDPLRYVKKRRGGLPTYLKGTAFPGGNGFRALTGTAGLLLKSKGKPRSWGSRKRKGNFPYKGR